MSEKFTPNGELLSLRMQLGKFELDCLDTIKIQSEGTPSEASKTEHIRRAIAYYMLWYEAEMRGATLESVSSEGSKGRELYRSSGIVGDDDERRLIGFNVNVETANAIKTVADFDNCSIEEVVSSAIIHYIDALARAAYTKERLFVVEPDGQKLEIILLNPTRSEDESAS